MPSEQKTESTTGDAMTERDEVEILVTLRRIFKEATHIEWTGDGRRVVEFRPESAVDMIEKMLASLGHVPK
jgi:hypothetical protein